MPDHSEAAARVAAQLPDGSRSLDNTVLRQLFGLSRVTPKARGEIAAALRHAGLEVLSDPAAEPLVVRRPEPVPAVGSQRVRSARAAKPWYRRKRVWALAAVALLLLTAGLAGDPDKTAKPDNASAGAAVTTTTAGAAPAATVASTPAEPPATFQDAVDQADDDHYEKAVAIATVLGADESDRITRKISRRLALRARRALRRGDRSAARSLISQASGYPRTSEIRSASTQVTAAGKRAAARRRARAAAAQLAREQRAEARRQARAQRVAERRAAAAAKEAESSGADGSDSSSGSGDDGAGYAGQTCTEIGHPYSVTPGTDLDHDADGDGEACESE